ncbi:hypothetical protein GWI33_009484 [Rhynchophorus ferrugineus]|uniref:Uncharacterized protein n=1 Tax=Rhynchophorus ferrugineus TaxID=354439 RepID=A0A834MAZ6_RHYFE|nr:hypothetical protein GWI33_009484 [Rhynchophorus ferrugineus]
MKNPIRQLHRESSAPETFNCHRQLFPVAIKKRTVLIGEKLGAVSTTTKNRSGQGKLRSDLADRRRFLQGPFLPRPRVDLSSGKSASPNRRKGRIGTTPSTKGPNSTSENG